MKKVKNSVGMFGLYLSYGSVAVSVKKEVRWIPSIAPFGYCYHYSIFRYTITLLSPWSLTLGDLSASSSDSPSLDSGISSKTLQLATSGNEPEKSERKQS